VFINIDPKTAEVATPLGQLLKRKKVLRRVCIGSKVYKRTLEVVSEAGGQDRICTVLTGANLIALGTLRLSHLALKRYLRRTKAGCLEIPYYMTSKKLVRTAHEAGLKVYVWTVNTRKGMEKALDQGVDGIISDETELLLKVMQGKGMPKV
jgi:glycerophosphoryl diester phosphodiesterase